MDALAAFARAAALTDGDVAAHEGLMRARVALAAAEPGRIGQDAVGDLAYDARYLLDARPEGRATWLTGLGNALAQGGDLSDAEQHLRAAVAADSTSVEVHTGLGLLLLRLGGQRDAAVAELQTAIGIRPHHLPAAIPLAQLALGDGDRERAKDILAPALAHRDHPTARSLFVQATRPASAPIVRPAPAPEPRSNTPPDRDRPSPRRLR